MSVSVRSQCRVYLVGAIPCPQSTQRLMYWTRPAGSLPGCDGWTPIIANGKARWPLSWRPPLAQGREFADGVASIDLQFPESQYRQTCGPLVEDAGHVPRLKGPLAD